MPANEARRQLRLTKAALRVDHHKTNQAFQNQDLLLYLFRLFQLSGLFAHLDVQGAWTLSLSTSTMGGRWFTVNIGTHEVAFATLPAKDERVGHCLVVDRLLLDYPETIIWIGNHAGEVHTAEYSGAERAVSIFFEESFAGAEQVFKLPGVRRALAYWFEKLADLRERQAKSSFARYHSLRRFFAIHLSYFRIICRRPLLTEGRHSRGVLMAEQAGGGRGDARPSPAAKAGNRRGWRGARG